MCICIHMYIIYIYIHIYIYIYLYSTYIWIYIYCDTWDLEFIATVFSRNPNRVGWLWSHVLTMAPLGFWKDKKIASCGAPSWKILCFTQLVSCKRCFFGQRTGANGENSYGTSKVGFYNSGDEKSYSQRYISSWDMLRITSLIVAKTNIIIILKMRSP